MHPTPLRKTVDVVIFNKVNEILLYIQPTNDS